MISIEMNASPASSTGFWAGAAVTDLTPKRSVFLYGYPHVARDSTGVHDPLQCAALYLRGEGGEAMFLANDLIHLTKGITADVRGQITAATGVPNEAIMVTATHTHSGPIIVEHVSNAADSTVPKPDPDYVTWVVSQMVAAALSAFKAARPAELGCAVARAEGVGTNRHNPRDLPTRKCQCLWRASGKAARPLQPWSCTECTPPCCTRTRP
jgi:neutral ceramidase